MIDYVMHRVLTLLLAMAIISGCGSGGGIFENIADSLTKSNDAPEISGSPYTAILVGDVYSFTPSASDADGDQLTFSIRNQPGWAIFDSITGRLSGSVLPGDEGVYDEIRISVSDGNTSRSLPDFSITVTNSAIGAMTLYWTPPTQNTDGSALTDLAGYNVYYGLSQGSYPNRVRIDNPSISTYMVENLLPNTYYVVATSFNTQGVESSFSNVTVKTVTPN